MWRHRGGFVRGRGQRSNEPKQSTPTQPNALEKWLSIMTDMNACDTSEPDASLADRSLVAGIVYSASCAVMLFLRDSAPSPSSARGRAGRAEAASGGWGPFGWPHTYTGPLVSMPARRMFLCGLSLAGVDLRKVLKPGHEIVVHLAHAEQQRWRDFCILQQGEETNQPPIYLSALWFIEPVFDSLVIQRMAIDRFFKDHDLSIDDKVELSEYFLNLVACDLLKNQTKKCHGKGKNQERKVKGQPEEKQKPAAKCQQQVKVVKHQQKKQETTGQLKGKDQPQKEKQQKLLKGQSDEKGHPQRKAVGKDLLKSQKKEGQQKGTKEPHDKGQQIQEKRLQDLNQQTPNGWTQEKGQRQKQVPKKQQLLKEQPDEKQKRPAKCQQQVKGNQQGNLRTETWQQKGKVQHQKEGMLQLKGKLHEKEHSQAKPHGTTTKLARENLLKSKKKKGQQKRKKDLRNRRQQMQGE